MQQPFDPNVTTSAPTPVLHGQASTSNGKEPSIVRDARLLCLFVLFIYGLFILIIVLAILPDPRHGAISANAGTLASLVGAFILALLLHTGLKRRQTIAWQIQIVISILGLFAIPVGTLIHGLILSKWFKPEVKNWFGIPVSPEFNR